MIEYDDATHTYRAGGVVVPSVTQVLGAFFPLPSAIPADVLERKRQIGTDAHLATELWDQDDLDEDSITPEIRPYLDAWISFREREKFVPTEIEKLVYHPALGYAGRLDRNGLLAGEEFKLDIKTSSAISPVTGPQTAAYQEAERSGLDVSVPMRRGAVQLLPDGTYRFKEFTERTDFAVFTSCLSLLNFKRKHNL